MKQFLEGLLFGVARMREGRMYAKKPNTCAGSGRSG